MQSEYLEESLGILIVFWGLLGAGILALIVVLSGLLHRRIKVEGVRPWNIEGTEFLFFLVAVVLWMVFSSSLAFTLAGMWNGGESTPLAGILASYLLQLGMLGIFLRFSSMTAHAGGHLFSSVNAAPRPVILRSVVGYLAMVPLIAGLSAGWIGILTLLQELGFDIELRTQDPVRMLAEVTDPLPLVMLVLLAAVLAPVAEELVFRAGIYRYFRARLSPAAAVLLSGFIFAMFHGNLQSFAGLLGIGLGLAVAYEITGNIRVAMLIHALHNILQIVLLLGS